MTDRVSPPPDEALREALRELERPTEWANARIERAVAILRAALARADQGGARDARAADARTPRVFDLYGKLAEACDDVGRQRKDEDFLQYGQRVVLRFRPIIDAYEEFRHRAAPEPQARPSADQGGATETGAEAEAEPFEPEPSDEALAVSARLIDGWVQDAHLGGPGLNMARLILFPRIARALDAFAESRHRAEAAPPGAPPGARPTSGGAA